MINYEIVAEEVVKTLVGSVGLILAVPITIFLAIWAVKKNETTNPPNLQTDYCLECLNYDSQIKSPDKQTLPS